VRPRSSRLGSGSGATEGCADHPRSFTALAVYRGTEWVRLVVELTLAADPPAALSFWDQASEKLAELVAAHPSAASELLTVRANWW